VTAGLGFTNLLLVAVIALVAPIAAAVLPLRVPSVVIEIVAGIVVGPAVLGWVDPDTPVAVLALVGLAFLLFLAGLEIDLRRLRGDVLRLSLLGFGLTLVRSAGWATRSSSLWRSVPPRSASSPHS
jgi:Kef-type K+ transport system membrane component KefB